MQKILAVLNDFKQADLVLGRAITLAIQQQALLEVLFVHEKPFFSIPDLFLSKAHIHDDRIDTSKIQHAIRERLEKLGYARKSLIFVAIDDTADRIHSQLKESRETLVLTAYHHKLTESILKKNHLPLLILKGVRSVESNRILLPVELNDSSTSCIHFTQSLFPIGTIELIYDNHIQTDPQNKKEREQAYAKLQKETGLRGKTIEEFAWDEADFGEDYDAIEKHLTASIRQGSYDLSVFCSQQGRFLYTEALLFSLLHTLETDFLFYRDCCE